MMPEMHRRRDQNGALTHHGQAYRPDGRPFFFTARKRADDLYQARIYDEHHVLEEEFVVSGYTALIEQLNHRSIVV